MRPDTFVIKLKNIEEKDWNVILEILKEYGRDYVPPVGKRYGVVYRNDNGAFLVYKTKTMVVVEKLSV